MFSREIRIANEEQWIDEAIVELNIPVENFQKYLRDDATDIIRNIKRRFVLGSPFAWWLSLKHKVVERHFAEGGYLHIFDFMAQKKNADVWLVPDIRERYQLAYRVRLADVVHILGNCCGFPYYVVATDYSTLIAESDDDVLYVCEYRVL